MTCANSLVWRYGCANPNIIVDYYYYYFYECGQQPFSDRRNFDEFDARNLKRSMVYVCVCVEMGYGGSGVGVSVLTIFITFIRFISFLPLLFFHSLLCSFVDDSISISMKLMTSLERNCLIELNPKLNNKSKYLMLDQRPAIKLSFQVSKIFFRLRGQWSLWSQQRRQANHNNTCS